MLLLAIECDRCKKNIIQRVFLAKHSRTPAINIINENSLHMNDLCETCKSEYKKLDQELTKEQIDRMDEFFNRKE